MPQLGTLLGRIPGPVLGLRLGDGPFARLRLHSRGYLPLPLWGLGDPLLARGPRNMRGRLAASRASI